MTKVNVIDCPDGLYEHNVQELRERLERARRRVAEVERQLKGEYKRGFADGVASVSGGGEYSRGKNSCD